MTQSQPDPQEIVNILEDVLAEWQLSHEQLSRMLGCSKESVENWLQKKCRPRPRALRAIELLRDHFQNGNPFPPRVAAAARKSADGFQVLDVPAELPPGSPFAVEASATVQRFFQAVGSKQFGVAWKCLSSAFQDRRWPNGLAEFTAGYDGFTSITNLIVVPLNPIMPPSCRVFVYYEDMTNIIELPGFGKWSGANLGQIEKCCQSLIALRDAILAAGAEKPSVEQVLISGLFTEQAGNILYSASQLTRERFFDAIKSTSTQQCLLSAPLIARVLRVNKGRFLIDQLLPISWGKRVPARN